MNRRIKINRIFLDLDGVIRDWTSGVYKWFEMEPQTPTDWGHCCRTICKEYGISQLYFWEKQTEVFWVTLEMLPYSQQILSLLPIEKTCLLTSPTLNNADFSQNWIKNRLPAYFDRKQYLIGPAKHFCAAPDNLLIDDSDTNIKKFKEIGGNTILFPQPWNENRTILEDTCQLHYLKTQLNLYDY